MRGAGGAGCEGTGGHERLLQEARGDEKTMQNSWFHTGDVATMDEDGFDFVVDRLKDMIMRGGYNVCLPPGDRGGPLPASGYRRGRGHWGAARGVERGR